MMKAPGLVLRTRLAATIALAALCSIPAAIRAQDSIPDSTARAQALRAVKILERKPVDIRIDEANQRRRAGFGYFVDSTQLAKLPGLREAFDFPNVHAGGGPAAWTIGVTGNFTISDITETQVGATPTASAGLPGTERGGFGSGRKNIVINGCSPTIYIDGIKEDQSLLPSLNKSDMALIEIFDRPTRVPLRYQMSSTCAAVLFWTKTYVNR